MNNFFQTIINRTAVKTLLLVIVLGINTEVNAATQTYNIAAGALINCTSNCGTTGSYYNGCGGAQIGFSWTDVIPAGNNITAVSIQVMFGIDCIGGTHTTTLNGAAGASVNVVANCACDGTTNGIATLAMPTGSYIRGGSNTFYSPDLGSCYGFYPGVSGYYAIVTVTYTPACTPPTNTTPTTSICSNGSQALATNGTGGSWSITNGAGGSISGSTYNANGYVGTVSVRYTDGVSCQSPIVSFTVNAAPSLGTLSNASICSGQTVTMATPYPTWTGGASATTSGNYRIVTFTSSGNFIIPTGYTGTFDVLVVGGGGGGGQNGGGGGGGGGVLYSTGFSVSPGTIAVTVGTGGAPGNNVASGGTPGARGGNSIFSTITAIGGGGGANRDYGGAPLTGGSGGGGGGGATGITGAAGTAGQGSAGRNGYNNGCPSAGGGGGGAGGLGNIGASNAGGYGGAGISNSITGSAVTYAGGGGGGPTCSPGVGGAGGAGGGGFGNGTNGTNGLGGGGGGNNGTGGSGVVIIRYLNPEGGTWSSSTGAATVNSSGVVSGVSGGTPVITYTTPSVGGCTASTAATVTVVSASAPGQPTTISGSATPCPGTALTYSVTNVAGVTYAWTFPSGWTGSSTTNSISLTPSTTAGTITVTPSTTCGGNGTARTLSVTPTYSVPAVSIAAVPSGGICAGTSVTFTATPTNGGTSPNYNFRIGGVSQQSGTSNTYTTTGLTNGQVVDCIITPASICVSPTTATSNTITMAVTSTVTPSVSIAITTGANPSCAGSSVTFTATPTQGGSSPTYNFRVGGSSVQNTTSATYTTTGLTNGQTVDCIMTSNATCPSPSAATSNSIVMTINALPAAPTSVTATPSTLCPGATVQLNATSAGNTIKWYTVATGGSSIGSSASAANFAVTPGGTTTYYAEANTIGSGSQTFSYTGGSQSFTVPAGVSGVTIETWGAQGGTGGYSGGLGGYSTGTLSVSPGNTLTVNVGGQPSGGAAGWNGGGSSGGCGGGGGGASDVRNSGGTKLIVAGGGGGGGCTVSGYTGSAGGVGGGLTGGASVAGSGGSGGSSGGTQVGGGGSTGCCDVGTVGTLGQGGNGAPSGCSGSYAGYGGGGGGGYYGGGGGGNCGGNLGGGGGSAYVGGVTGGTTSSGVRSGNGQVIITWTGGASCPSASRTSVVVTATTAVTPAVSIAASPSGGICAGTSVTFTATPTNPGTGANYNFRVNGSSVQSGTSATYTSTTLTNGQTVDCILTPANLCVSPTTATSNTITMSVTSIVVPSVSIAITTGANPSCAGSSVTFTASPTNGGGSPTYNFRVGGSTVQNTTSNTYTTTGLTNGQTVDCIMTSNAACPSPSTATSNSIAMAITAIPAAPTPVTASPTNACPGATTNLNGTSAGNNIHWFTASTGGSAFGTSVSGANYALTTPVNNTTYYAAAVSGGSGSQTFTYTGSTQTFTVPGGITSITIDAYGAQGGASSSAGGLGGRSQGTLTVSGGQVLNIYVGGQSGWNGGGSGANGSGAGGGASDIRVGGTAFANRVIVAGGGGGSGLVGGSWTGEYGGAGGGVNGVQGGSSSGYTGTPGAAGGGGGGSGSGGAGTAGCGCGPGGTGALGTGGNGIPCTTWGTSGGGGGGGGYYGGGGGGVCGGGDGGGGGSSYTGGVTGGTTSSGVRSGNGQVIISWTGGASCPSTTRTAVNVVPMPSPTDNVILANGIATATTICLGQSVTISSSGGSTANYCYWASTDGGSNWNILAGQNCNTSSFSYTPPAAGTYRFHVRNSDACGYCWDVGRSCPTWQIVDVTVTNISSPAPAVTAVNGASYTPNTITSTAVALSNFIGTAPYEAVHLGRGGLRYDFTAGSGWPLCANWGLPSTISDIMYAGSPAVTTTNYSDFTLDLAHAETDLTNGKLCYTGTTTYYYQNTSSLTANYSVPARLRIDASLPIQAITTGHYLVKATGTFDVQGYLEAQAPANGIYYTYTATGTSSGTTINLTAINTNLRVGLTVTGAGITGSRRITAISANGLQLTLNTAVNTNQGSATTFSFTVTPGDWIGTVTLFDYLEKYSSTVSIYTNFTPDQFYNFNAAAPTVTTSPSPPCTGATFTLQGSNGTYIASPCPLTYSWTGPTTITNPTNINATTSATSGGTYNFVLSSDKVCYAKSSVAVTISANNTAALTSAVGTNAQTKCINTAITNITYSTTGATGATFSGLPAGVTGGWAANVVTISGTPTASGNFSYTVTLTGGCGTVTATGTIAVTANNTVALTSAVGTDGQTKCINTAITNITYSTTGATGATFSGLPAGVVGSWGANVATISGTPTASGNFSYTVTLTGGCGTVTATGTIAITANNTVALTSAVGTNNQNKCLGSAITSITYSTTGATGATVTGLPTGVTGGWATNVVTISGTPTVTGTFNYSVSLTGGCGTISASGTIAIQNAFSAGTIASTGQTIGYNSTPANITYTTAPSGGTTPQYQWYKQAGSIACPSGAFAIGSWTAVGSSSTSTPTLTGATIGALTATTTFALRVTDVGVSACYDNWAGSCHVVTVGVVEVTSVSPSSGPNYYGNVKGAFDAINAGTHQGTITIRILTSVTETVAAVLNANGSGSANYSSVVMYPAAANLTVSGSLNTPIIDLNGADNVTIDGRLNGSGASKSLTIQNLSNGTGTGNSAIRFINGAKTNTVRDLILKAGARTTSGGVVFFSTASGGNGNNDNTITNNDITGIDATTRVDCGISSVGTAGSENTDNTISNNNIFNTWYLNRTSYGILVSSNSKSFTVMGNSIYETTAFSPTAIIGFRAIQISGGATNGGHVISGNYIGGTAPSCSGSAMTLSSATVPFLMYGIIATTANSTTDVSSLQGNTIANIDLSSKYTDPFRGIQVDAQGGVWDIGTVTGNIIGAATGTGSITLTSPNSLAAQQDVTATATATVNVTGGVIQSVTVTNPGGVYSSALNAAQTLAALRCDGAPCTPTTAAVFNASSISATGGYSTITLNGGQGGSGYTGVVTMVLPAPPTSSNSYAMLLSSNGTLNVQNNRIASINVEGSADYSHNFYAIYRNAGASSLPATINNNFIGSSTANSISCMATNNAIAQSFWGIRNNCATPITMSGNIVENISNNYFGTATSFTVAMDGTNGSNTINDNIIRNITSASASTGSTSNSQLQGIRIATTTASTTQTISGNTIYNLIASNGSAAVHVTGIYVGALATGSHTISENFIHSLTTSSVSTSASVFGIRVNTGSATYSNNIINLGSGITNSNALYGIYETGAATNNYNFYHNSIYIGGSASGNTSTYAMYSNANTNVRNYRNNIFVNARSRTGGTGTHYSMFFNITSAGSLTLDYNDYYVSGTGGVIGRYNGANVTVLPIIAGQDVNSVSTDPAFASPGGTTAANYIPATLNSGANNTGIGTDYAGTNRTCAFTMGAYEIPINPAAPVAPSGNTPVCPALSGITYTILPVVNATSYNWTVPTGWTFTGSGTSITATSGSVGQNGNISVSATNVCGTSAVTNFPVTVSLPVSGSTTTWTGLGASGNDNWNLSNNWDNCVPNLNIHAVMSADPQPVNQPNINSAGINAKCKTLTMPGTSTLTISSNCVNCLEVGNP